MHGHAAQQTSPVQPKLAGPLYNQIQLLMRERILAREWRDGKNLPTEVDLAREYSVSVGTMRKALDVLEDAKFIVRKQGLGTFVRDFDGVAGAQQSGWTVNGKMSAERIIRVISTASSEASTGDCTSLDIAPRSTVYRVKVVSTIDRRGMILDDYVIPETTSFARDRNDADGLQQALQTLERQATRFIESISVEAATPGLAQNLRVEANSPLLRIERTAVDAKGRPMFMCIRAAHLDGARYKVEVDSP